nr:MAG TPA: hypothetical protein [Caudoviricetes sp.]
MISNTIINFILEKDCVLSLYLKYIYKCYIFRFIICNYLKAKIAV